MTETIVARFLVRLAVIPEMRTSKCSEWRLTVREGIPKHLQRDCQKQLALLKQLASLSVIDRIIIEMVHFEGAPADVVCRRLGLPPDRIAVPLAKLSGKTAPVATVSKRRPENESRPRPPYANIPGGVRGLKPRGNTTIRIETVADSIDTDSSPSCRIDFLPTLSQSMLP